MQSTFTSEESDFTADIKWEQKKKKKTTLIYLILNILQSFCDTVLLLQGNNKPSLFISKFMNKITHLLVSTTSQHKLFSLLLLLTSSCPAVIITKLNMVQDKLLLFSTDMVVFLTRAGSFDLVH